MEGIISLTPDPRFGALFRTSLALGGLAGAAGVISLALSAHSSASSLLQTAGQMLLSHAPLFICIALLSRSRDVPFLAVSATSLTLGLTLFSGDLISRAFLSHKLFSMAAPTGGILIILAWLTVVLSALRTTPK